MVTTCLSQAISCPTCVWIGLHQKRQKVAKIYLTNVGPDKLLRLKHPGALCHVIIHMAGTGLSAGETYPQKFVTALFKRG